MLEHVQRRATKYILNDYTSSYKSILQQLQVLPLMYIYELNDAMFLINFLKLPTANFSINQFISLNFISSNTRSGDHLNLYIPEQHSLCTIIFTLTVLPDLELFTGDKHNTASPHYQAENKIISLRTFH